MEASRGRRCSFIRRRRDAVKTERVSNAAEGIARAHESSADLSLVVTGPKDNVDPHSNFQNGQSRQKYGRRGRN